MQLFTEKQSKPLLIVLTGNTFPEISASQGDFADWIAAGLTTTQPCFFVDARDNAELPPPSTLAGVVVSGSHAMVSDCADWSERLASWLRACVETKIPVLGICYGHQLLAHAMGGKVGYREQGIEIGTHAVTLAAGAAGDVMFQSMPQHFPAQLVHAQSVLTLPPGAVLLASSAEEAHQAFRIGCSAWGVQFHPEFSANAMRGYIRQKASDLTKQQREPEVLISTVQETSQAASLLRLFASKVVFDRV